MEKHVYMVQVIWSTDDDTGVETNIFSTYEKAQKSFYNTVNGEIENTWVSEFIKDGNYTDEVDFDTTNYHYKDGDEMYRKWIIREKYDWSYSTQVVLDVMELL